MWIGKGMSRAEAAPPSNLIESEATFSEAARADLETARRLLEGQFRPVLDRLYDSIQLTPEMAAMVPDAATRERLVAAQIAHWRSLLAGQADEALREKARRIGLALGAREESGQAAGELHRGATFGSRRAAVMNTSA